MAKNIVAAGLARQCQVQVTPSAWPSPSTSPSTLKAPASSPTTRSPLVRDHFDLRPKGIVNMLDLLRPIYTKTAAYGHFGRSEPEFSWEATDKVQALKKAV